jgi:hypothetical protein
VTAVAGFLLLIASCPASAQTTQGLFSQAAKATLERNFASPDLSCLLIDASGANFQEILDHYYPNAVLISQP